ncbi:MAG: hypothetical protein PHU06_06255 [Gallionella sp.]|nr:hypothetical protein [Gallionella sp.]MDD4958432.1 hypothetical protein [Gallionella sp.]
MRYIYSPIYPISTKLDVSHRSGWVQYWALQLGDCQILTGHDAPSVTGKDELYIYHGMEFNGSLNLQSGISPALLTRLHALSTFMVSNPIVISLDIRMPDYAALLTDRADGGGLQTKHLAGLRSLLGAPVWIRPPDFKDIVIGDSHALAMNRPETAILRHDKLTLHGALKRGLKNLMLERLKPKTKIRTLTVYFGNIDVRHHLCRYSGEQNYELVAEYENQLKDLAALWKPKFLEVVSPLPIEHESRKLPKTGYYQGTPFYGTWCDRQAVKQILAGHLLAVCEKNGWSFVAHPDQFINDRGELRFEVMEKPQSVHIRPSYYRSEWGRL